MLARMRGIVAMALGTALLSAGCAAGQSSPTAPEPVVVVVGEPAQQKPTTAAAEAKSPKQALQRERARNAGILGVLRGPQDQLKGAFGSGVGDALGGLSGSGSGDAFGLGGLGLGRSGSSPWGVSGGNQGGIVGGIVGGGGLGQGIGLGSLGTRGFGSGTGSGYGSGYRSGSGLGASAALRPTYPDTVQVSGNGLSIEAVQTVGRSHKSDIDECFRIEQERSGVRGGITIACTVGPSGAVTRVAVADSTLPGVELGDCIAQAVGSWTFPAPSTGAAVTILLPFRF
jgi:hypothetical protein